MTPGPWKIHAWSGEECFIKGANGAHVTMTMVREDAPFVRAVPEMVAFIRTVAERDDDTGATARALLESMQ